MAKIFRFQRKPAELIPERTNSFMPSAQVVAQFQLPNGLDIHQVAAVAATIDLVQLGIVAPHCKYPDRFEEGVRYGLAHNCRTDIKTHFRPLFSTGFCWAKMFYRKFAPHHQLAASGSFKMRMDRNGVLEKMKDI